MSHDGCISPRVLCIETLLAVSEEQQIETLVKPDGLAVRVEEILPTFRPRLVTGCL